MTKFDHITIKNMNEAVNMVQRLDASIKNAVSHHSDDGSFEHVGRTLKNLYGSPVLHEICATDMGALVFCAMVNELLRRREALVSEYEDVIEFPPAPCEPQHMGDQE